MMMLRLALMILLLTAQPVWAADMWEKACAKDLTVTLNNHARVFGYRSERHGEFRTEIPRSLGAVHALCIDEVIALAKQREWGKNEKFRQRFIAELVWVQTLLKGDMAEAHRQAKIYRALGNEGAIGILATYLNQWAAEHKYPPAEFDVIQENFLRFRPPHSDLRLMNLADQGYVPAMLDAARRFLNGDALEKNLGKAYYWIKRAEAAHGDLSGIIEKPYERLLEQMTDHEKGSLVFFSSDYGKLE